jgi:hypothetical protein
MTTKAGASLKASIVHDYGTPTRRLNVDEASEEGDEEEPAEREIAFELRRHGWLAAVYGVAHPGARQGTAERSERALLRHVRATRT